MHIGLQEDLEGLVQQLAQSRATPATQARAVQALAVRSAICLIVCALSLAICSVCMPVSACAGLAIIRVCAVMAAAIAPTYIRRLGPCPVLKVLRVAVQKQREVCAALRPNASMTMPPANAEQHPAMPALDVAAGMQAVQLSAAHEDGIAAGADSAGNTTRYKAPSRSFFMDDAFPVLPTAATPAHSNSHASAAPATAPHRRDERASAAAQPATESQAVAPPPRRAPSKGRPPLAPPSAKAQAPAAGPQQSAPRKPRSFKQWLARPAAAACVAPPQCLSGPVDVYHNPLSNLPSSGAQGSRAQR